MSVLKCDDCGRFTAQVWAVWHPAPSPGIDRDVCERCAGRLGIDTEATEDGTADA